MGPASFYAISPVPGHVEVEQVPFAHAIARCYLHAWPFFNEHKLDGLEAVANGVC